MPIVCMHTSADSCCWFPKHLRVALLIILLIANAGRRLLSVTTPSGRAYPAQAASGRPGAFFTVSFQACCKRRERRRALPRTEPHGAACNTEPRGGGCSTAQAGPATKTAPAPQHMIEQRMGLCFAFVPVPEGSSLRLPPAASAPRASLLCCFLNVCCALSCAGGAALYALHATPHGLENTLIVHQAVCLRTLGGASDFPSAGSRRCKHHVVL